MSPPVFVAARAGLLAGTVRLEGSEGRHAATVRRLTPGERVDVTDGAGLLAECVVATVGRDTIDLDVVQRREVPRPQPRLVAVQALPKGDRGELSVSMMTEVGVDAVVPWAASRCVTRWQGPRGEKALGHWRAAAREAAKQSRRAWIPEVAALATTADVASLLGRAAVGLVLHERAGQPLAAPELPDAGEVVVVIGPEGGLSDEELESFAAVGAHACRLGPTVLRTSTAGVAALSVLSARTERWS